MERAVTVEDLRARAHRFLARFALEYLEGGAEEEATLQRNRSALAEYRFVPRALVDVAHRDIGTTLFGRRLPVPLVVAPTGLNGVFRAHADRMLAQAAAERGVPFTQSTMSNDPMRSVADVANLRHWWQLYVFGPPKVRETLIGRAEAAGCEALVITIDAQIFGNREWSRRDFVNPGHLTARSLLDAALHPRWAAAMLLGQGMPVFENIIEFVPQEHHGFFDSAFWVRSQMRKDLDWAMVREIRDRWPRKLLIKGVLDVDAVRRVAAIGADGVVLSNHGGRQLDWAISGLDCLPDARAAVGPEFTILVDGGFRRGSDVIKALALGANAVQIGRAALYGVAAGGQAGVERAIEIFCEEIDRTLGLLGCDSIGALDASVLTRRPPLGATV